MHPLESLIPHTEALRRILETVRPVEETEKLPLLECGGRVLAEPLVAMHDVPRFARAAMDGYAVRAADAKDAVTLRSIGRVHAGEEFKQTLEAGQCVEIATGAPIPAGADAVVQVEWTKLDGESVRIERAVRLGQNVSPSGSDLKLGSPVLLAGQYLSPARLAVAAAAGADKLVVFRRPKVTVVSTGRELRPIGTELGPGEIHDSNGPALTILFQMAGAEVMRAGIVHDRVDDLRNAIQRHATSDLIVFSGGSSAGEHDVVREAVKAEGEILFHGVRVKPGKPLLLGRAGKTVIVGLPGYPVSCVSDAYLFILPAVSQIARKPVEPARRVRARLSQRVESVPGRLWFLPVRLDRGIAIPTYKESGATTSLADAVGYVEVPPDVPALEEGEEVEAVLF